MKRKPGRKSASNIVPIVDSALKLREKPTAPDTLNSDERAVWKMVIDIHQYDWLSLAQVPILVQYCRHTVAADLIAKRLHDYADLSEAGSTDNTALNAWLKLLASQERESRAIIAAARTLRITNQSRFQNTDSHIRPDDDGADPWLND